MIRATSRAWANFRRIMATGIVILSWVPATARQTGPTYCPGEHNLSVEPPETCVPTPGFPIATSPSRCWDQYVGGTPSCVDWGPIGLPTETGRYIGFPLNLNLGFGVAPPNFPPRTLDRASGSWPVITREGEHFLRPAAAAERSTLQGVVDLITGAPLIQNIDFELPFGGAVYRHVRTYSEYPALGLHEFDCYFEDPLQCHSGGFTRNGSQLYWDWHGTGWMSGDSPILLVDASYWGTWKAGTPETWCYLILDAHHSIPFKCLRGKR